MVFKFENFEVKLLYEPCASNLTRQWYLYIFTRCWHKNADKEDPREWNNAGESKYDISLSKYITCIFASKQPGQL